MVAFGKYVLTSVAATIGIIYYAYHTREQFYPAMIYLATSKISIVVLSNMATVTMLLFGQMLKSLFLGQLREAEVEWLYDLSRHEIMETCLAMTIFREEFTASFLAMFAALLFVKVFHWLSQKRVEYIETTPSVSALSHIRIITFMVLLLLVDCFFLVYSITQTAKSLRETKGPSVLLLFAFEYVILASSIVVTLTKYALYMVDMVMENQWESKAIYVFYLELFRDLLHLIVYIIFFAIIFMYYGLPLHLIRDLYETFRNFKVRMADFIRYRRITSNMNDRFADATPEELGSGDATCIICREEMASAKKLPCGHVFHLHCLRSWLERQQTCPTCRAPVLPSPPPPPPRAPEAAAQQPAAAPPLHPNPPAGFQGHHPVPGLRGHHHPPPGLRHLYPPGLNPYPAAGLQGHYAVPAAQIHHHVPGHEAYLHHHQHQHVQGLQAHHHHVRLQPAHMSAQQILQHHPAIALWVPVIIPGLRAVAPPAGAAAPPPAVAGATGAGAQQEQAPPNTTGYLPQAAAGQLQLPAWHNALYPWVVMPAAVGAHPGAYVDPNAHTQAGGPNPHASVGGAAGVSGPSSRPQAANIVGTSQAAAAPIAHTQVGRASGIRGPSPQPQAASVAGTSQAAAAPTGGAPLDEQGRLPAALVQLSQEVQSVAGLSQQSLQLSLRAQAARQEGRIDEVQQLSAELAQVHAASSRLMDQMQDSAALEQTIGQPALSPEAVWAVLPARMRQMLQVMAQLIARGGGGSGGGDEDGDGGGGDSVASQQFRPPAPGGSRSQPQSSEGPSSLQVRSHQPAGPAPSGSQASQGGSEPLLPGVREEPVEGHAVGSRSETVRGREGEGTGGAEQTLGRQVGGQPPAA